MKALIIDDEAKARSLLNIILQENCEEISEIFEASTLLSGVEIIKKEEPKLIFLDIEMPEHSGLEILNFIDKTNYNFEIIFVTAYSEHAVRAFELSAVDYLLKPARPTKVKGAVQKALSQLGKSRISIKLEELKKSLTALNYKKVGLPHSNGTKFVNFEDIIVLEADGMYTKVSMVNSDDVLVCKPLRFFDSVLADNINFYRIHRSFLINLMYMTEYVKKEGGYVVMENGKNVSISKDNKEEFLTIVKSI